MIPAAQSDFVTRREARRLDRREAILAVAMASFLEHGYAGTTMSGIAGALGGSKGTLWNYFPSKEELFAAVLDYASAAFRFRLSEILHPCGDLTTTLRNFCTSFLNKLTSPDAIALHRLVVAEAGRFPEMGQIFFERASGPTRSLLADFLSGAMDRGLLRRDDPASAARVLTALFMAGCYQRMMLGLLEKATPQLIDADVDLTIDLFLRAYAPQ